MGMIGRFWRGWTTTQQALAYKELFRTSILPELQGIDGFVGAYVLRRDPPDAGEGEVEICTFTLFTSLEAVRTFAGNEPGLAHVTPEARQILTRFERTVTHFEVVFRGRGSPLGRDRFATMMLPSEYDTLSL
jgi:heme-degrading monooxygenase HmoA